MFGHNLSLFPLPFQGSHVELWHFGRTGGLGYTLSHHFRSIHDFQCPVLIRIKRILPSWKNSANTFVEWYKDYIGPSKDPMEPISDIYYPIFEQAADLVVLPSPNQESFPILGFLALSIYWRDMIKDILPLGMDGIVIVFENPCNPTFTYEIVSSNMCLGENITLVCFHSFSHFYTFLFSFSSLLSSSCDIEAWMWRGISGIGWPSPFPVYSHEGFLIFIG